MSQLLRLLAVCSMTLPAGHAASSVSSELQFWSAHTVRNNDQVIKRFSIESRLKQKLSRRWQVQGTLALEHAHDDVGLGTVDTYDRQAKPLVSGGDTRLELRQLVLRYRKGKTSFSLGRQTFAWGVIDGYRVTDRLDPVRRRDFVFTEQKPERIPRWSARLRTTLEGYRVDLALIADSTVSQLPKQDSALLPTASRFTGGLPFSPAFEPSIELQTGRQSLTGAIKVSRRLRSGMDAAVLAFRGPDTEPVLAHRSGRVLLTFPKRTLLGGYLQQSLGDQVVRAEVAYLPDQRVNTGGGLGQERVRRWIAGVGADRWLAGKWFVLGQMTYDRIFSTNNRAVRPKEDVLATLRLQRRFLNDRGELKFESVNDLRKGDGYFASSLKWSFRQNIDLLAGGEWIYGADSGIFGQFEQQSRVWLKARIRI